MLSAIKTPGVYIQQSAELPLSGTRQNTAVPAFVGYTQKAIGKDAEDLTNKPVLIKTLADYEFYFGSAPEPRYATIRVKIDDLPININPDIIVPVATHPKRLNVLGVYMNRFFLYDSIRLYFANGGAECYIVSVGNYYNSIESTRLIDGINILEKEEEPTLLVCPDAALLNEIELASVQKACLNQCASLQDRFSIIDIREATDWTTVLTSFRQKIGTQNLNYGSAYGPWLRTAFPFEISYENITVHTPSPLEIDYRLEFAIVENELSTIQLKNLTRVINSVSLTNPENYLSLFDALTITNPENVSAHYFGLRQLVYIINIAALDLLSVSNVAVPFDNQININNIRQKTKVGDQLNDIIRQLMAYDLGFANLTPSPQSKLDIVKDADYTIPDYNLTSVVADSSIYGSIETKYFDTAKPVLRELLLELMNMVTVILFDLNKIAEEWTTKLKKNNPIYTSILQVIIEKGITIPASGAVTGVYVKTDNERGVWKAPANVALKDVLAPAYTLTQQDQEDWNMPNDGSGKAVNAIRAFTGQGTVIWGARTLTGNDNEWRYVNVRRLFISMEETLKKEMAYLTFEANDANTWLKAKSIALNYLIGIWQRGALVGSVPAEAFFVNIGLGETMTAQDILDGRMIVEVGVAVARPSEFIILKITHNYLQQKLNFKIN